MGDLRASGRIERYIFFSVLDKRSSHGQGGLMNMQGMHTGNPEEKAKHSDAPPQTAGHGKRLDLGAT